MNVLGIIAFGENPAACLLVDGKLFAMAAEERFTRLKVSSGQFPKQAVAYCLASAGLGLGDVGCVAFAWDARKYPWGMLRNLTSNYLRYRSSVRKAHHYDKGPSSIPGALRTVLKYTREHLVSEIRQGLRAAGLKGDFPPIEFVPHHLCHAYSTYFCSPFEHAGILTIDGSGEDICTELCLGERDTVRVVDSIPIPHSLGWFYAAITEYLGFIPYRDESKVMGLAALGEKRRNTNRWIEPLSRILRLSARSYEVDVTYTKYGGHFYADRYTDALVDLITSVDPEASPIAYGEKVQSNGALCSRYLLDTYVDLAFAAQELLEQAGIMLARRLVSEHGVENLCLAGGVAMNCKMNGELLRRSGCKRIFVQPASSDDGAALGAAMCVAQQQGDDARNRLKNVYYGPGFSNDEIRQAAENCKMPFREISDPAHEAAKLLEQSAIIAWFQDRMEFGARALGARSILANPAGEHVKNKINANVKFREGWRPFCPSLIDASQSRYLQDPGEASFMIVAYPGTDEMKALLPAVVHVDGSVRPQVVSQDANPLFYRLLEEFGNRSGHPVVLNTSFNVRGEPIICTPLEAIRCFYSNGLAALIMGDFLFTKTSC